MAYQFKIIFQDEDLVVINKPTGFHVHAPEKSPEKVPRSKIILQQLRNQVGKIVYPVHRLDVPTSGVLVFAFSSEMAGILSKQFQLPSSQKIYWAVVRGYVAPEGMIDVPLLSDSSNEMLAAVTKYKSLHRIEIPQAIGTKHTTSRYSWLEVRLETGRFHQIRRHMNRISHPVIGDAEHGDLRHNQFFRDRLMIPGLCLHCLEMSFEYKGNLTSFKADPPAKWNKIKTFFNLP